jgi:hypothetical protein
VTGWGGSGRARRARRLIAATDTQGQRRTILTSLLDETAERITQLRAYRWTIESVCRGLKRVLQLDTLSRVSPAGMALQVAVARIVYGLLLLDPEEGTVSLTALQRRLKTELHRAIFAAGMAEGERRQRARTTSGSSPPRLRAVGYPGEGAARRRRRT